MSVPTVPAAAGIDPGFNTSTPHHPDLVVRATAPADVVAAVRLARETGRTVAVRATGHGAGPTGPGTILVDTAGLADVSIDPVARTATVGAGATWQQVLDAAAPFGLGGLAGSAPGVGVVGYTLGGGLGPVARTFGLAADHVLALDVVTADGGFRRVDAVGDPELFWAIRGGGAAFGLVTGLTMGLVGIREVYGGGLWFSADVARTVLRAWRDWTATLPASTSSSLARLNLPSAPELPEPLRGRPVVHVRVAHVGDPAQGQRLVAPLRAAATPLLDGLGVLPYAALGAIHADPTTPMPVHERGVLLAALPPAAVEAFADVTSVATGLPIAAAELRLLGGAVGGPPAVPSAAPGRDAAFTLHALGVLAPPIADAVPAAVDAVLARLEPWSTGGAMPNFAGPPDAVAGARIRRAFGPDALARLDALRAALDPRGLFAPAARWTAARS
ncbi:FAD-binding oxidoreductase [Pseudonocardia humida]|uniref:FAD-binding oxidoreductase n=1 Tax=Pseudonocardia humida TaxID=2800819 RepID=A0ABT0ZSR4_9PSEU|nr:FAD-binding oxidoreductase [Pseudonocardia humida]MCO1653747.1 FAD-binding oxidoreductase [Pseudonocardia humida]